MTSILLVDDDPLQASLILSVLEQRFGYVGRVSDAAEALCLIEQREFTDNLRLVISGHHLPGMGGPVFVKELRSREPDLPILVLGAIGETAADYTAEHVCFLAKPFAATRMLNLASWMLADPKAAVA
jgi:DNA-binding NtrC family response regulator